MRRVIANPRRRAVLLAAASAVAGALHEGYAQSNSWTYNASASWSDAAGWLDGLVADGAGNLAGFTGIGALSPLDTLTITLDTNRTIGSLLFSDADQGGSPAGWRIVPDAAQILTLDSGSSAQPAIQANNLGSGLPLAGTLEQKVANINVRLAGTLGFNKTGAGTLVLSGNNAGLSGSITLTQGNLVLASSNALGSATLLTNRGGLIAIRRDSAANYSATDILLRNDGTMGTGNSISVSGLYGSGSNQTHTIGGVTINPYGVRTLGVSGSNGYGLSMGTLTLRDGVNLINQGGVGSLDGAGLNNNVNGLGSGLVTVNTIAYTGAGSGTINLGGVGSLAGDITITNGVTNAGGGSAALVYSGSKRATIGGLIATGGDTYVTGGTTGSVVNGDYQAGVGTLVIGSGTLPSNRALTINGGTVLLNGGVVTTTLSALSMGGATLTSGPVPAYLSSGAGTIVLGSGGIVVDDSIFFDAGTTSASATATAGSIAGRVDLGGANRSIAVNGSSALVVDAIVSGGGGIVKSGTGLLGLSNANTFSGNLDIVDGVLAGTVQGAGNPFGATAPNVSLGGALRLNGLVSAGAGTIGTLTSKDSGIHSGLIVDASAGGATTLHIGTWGGRESGTRGTVKIVPVAGSLNTSEIITIANNPPALTLGMLPAYFAVQNSGSDTKLTFASRSGNNLTAFSGYVGSGTTAIASAATTNVFDQVSGNGSINPAGQTLFGLRIGDSAAVTGDATLTLGGAGSGFGGLILNGSATLGASTLTFGSDEGVIWSGGANRNTVSSTIVLGGDLTMGGSQELALAGAIHLGGATRNLSVTGGAVTISADNALTNTGSIVKRGGGVLVIGGNNPGFGGTITIAGGTLQIGASPSGDVGSGKIINNANLAIHRSDAATFTNAISGIGDVWVDGQGTGIITLNGPLNYGGRTTVQSGVLRVIGGPNRLPSTTNLNVLNNATFQLNGNALQTVASLFGSGTIINNAFGDATLTVNGGGTFTGSIRSGTGNMSLAKSGAGTLILDGTNTFNRRLLISGGTVQLNRAAAAGSGSIELNNAALTLNHNQQMTAPMLTVIGSSTISIIATQAEQITAVQDGAGPGIGDAANFLQGTGTLNLVLNGRQFGFGQSGASGSNSNPSVLNQFSGTLRFDDSNPAGSTMRFFLQASNPVYTAGAVAATFAFGNGNLVLNHRNGSSMFNMGYVSGGTNTILEGNQNQPNRDVTYNFGFLPGDQTYYGQIRNYTTNGGIGIVSIQKLSSSSTLTLRNTMSFTGGITANAGTLALGSGANVTSSRVVVANGGTLSILPGAAITSSQIEARTNPGFATGGINVEAFGGGGFATPAGLTYTGGGTIYGNVNHNAGTISGGGSLSLATLTFANGLHLNGGNVDFNVAAGSVNVVGGSNDLLRVPTSGGVSLNGGLVRLNFGNTGSAGLTVGDYYPLMEINGAVAGAGTTSIEANAYFHGAFSIERGTGSLSNTLGAKVNGLGGATADLIWNPISAETNVWAPANFKNFKPVGGVGSLFYFTGDAVTFDDSSTIRTVMLSPGLAPAGITVNTNNTYIFAGEGLGSIIGSTGITKNGSGTLYLAGRNTFTGGITVNGGALGIGDPNISNNSRDAFANGTVVFNNDSDFLAKPAPPGTFGGPDGGTFVMNPGEHFFFMPSSSQIQPWNTNFVGTGTVVFQRPGPATDPNTVITFQADDWVSFGGTIRIPDSHSFRPPGAIPEHPFADGSFLRPTGGGSSSMTLDLGNGYGAVVMAGANQTFTMGALRGGVNTFLKLPSSNAHGTFAFAGQGPMFDSTFHGRIKATNATVVSDAPIQLAHLVKSGSGSTLTLTQSQTFVGNTIVNGGTLALVNIASNMLASPTITIGSGGTLDVSGLNGGAGGMTMLGNQRLISNGDVVGGVITAVTTSTITGTRVSNLEMYDGSTLAPGNSVGTLVTDTLTLGATNLLIEMDGSAIDSLVVTQNDALSIGATVPVYLANYGIASAGTYTLLDYSGNPANYSSLASLFSLNGQVGYSPSLYHNTADTKLELILTNNVGQWFSSNTGAWSTASEWTLDNVTPSPVVPNSVKFGSFITTPVTISPAAGGNSALGVIFDTPAKVTIANTGTVSLFVPTGGDAVQVLQGTHLVQAPVVLGTTSNVAVSPGAGITFGGNLSNINSASLTKTGGGVAAFTRLRLTGGALNVSGGTVSMTVKPSPNTVEGTNIIAALSIAAGAAVDLANNALVIDYATLGTALSDLRGELQDGRLFSSTAAAKTRIGYRDNANVPNAGGLGLASRATFAGVAVDPSSILARVTYDGDTNLDGVVNVTDLYNLAMGWMGSDMSWQTGDFTYDGLVNSADLTLLAQNWQSGVGDPLPATDLGSALTAAGIPLNAVPEPAAGLVLLAPLALLRRRRRFMSY